MISRTKIICYSKASYSNIQRCFAYLDQYMTLMMSLYIYTFHNIDFIYTPEYLFSSTQQYEHMTNIIYVLTIYLIYDLIYNFSNYYNTCAYDTIIHHINTLYGIFVSLLGYNIGISNNLIRNEFSSVWLALLLLSYKSDNILFKKLNPFFMIIFSFTFILYRIIPCSIMMYIIIDNYILIFKDNINISLMIMFIIHLSLQYYWFSLIIKKIYLIIHKQFCKTVKNG
jgi:hypothetical protein